ncbi:hypothetical protein FRX31_026111 [Thalictrum thalictroides]|uniref:Uncharacterized protein n=1 Tax=Thalictrum thalictroides TaxID=46969 RepID=A0A7J6VI98_THATH|nr:hypothetical protein FRX31_026111 [Thalictrum thalictroides]
MYQESSRFAPEATLSTASTPHHIQCLHGMTSASFLKPSLHLEFNCFELLDSSCSSTLTFQSSAIRICSLINNFSKATK